MNYTEPKPTQQKRKGGSKEAGGLDGVDTATAWVIRRGPEIERYTETEWWKKRQIERWGERVKKRDGGQCDECVSDGGVEAAGDDR